MLLIMEMSLSLLMLMFLSTEMAAERFFISTNTFKDDIYQK